MQTKIEARDREISGLRNELDSCKLQLKKVTGVSIRQDLKIKENSDKIEQLHRQINRDILRIQGIKDTEASAATMAANFFKNQLKIEQEIKLSDVYKSGKGKFKTIVIQLQSIRDRALIFSHVKNLKNVVNEVDRPYQIKEHMTAKAFAAKKRQQSLLAKNKKLSAAETLVMNVQKQQLQVAGVPYKKSIHPPSCAETLDPSTVMLTRQLAVELAIGDEVRKENQVFVGYAACVKTMEDVNAGYAKVVSLCPQARHVLGACLIPGRDFHVLADFHDDDEHGIGAELLNILEGSDLINRAVYIARFYDGTHIGPLRVEAILEAAHLALLSGTYNSVTKTFQQPQTKEEIQTRIQASHGGRGGRVGRGGRGGLRRQNLGRNQYRDEESQDEESINTEGAMGNSES